MGAEGQHRLKALRAMVCFRIIDLICLFGHRRIYVFVSFGILLIQTEDNHKSIWMIVLYLDPDRVQS